MKATTELTNEEYLSVLASLQNEHGYFVVYSATAAQLGQVVPFFIKGDKERMDFPLVVVGEASEEDITRQEHALGYFGRVRPSSGYFYRVCCE